jgi:hypothetical protein
LRIYAGVASDWRENGEIAEWVDFNAVKGAVSLEAVLLFGVVVARVG